MVTVYERGAESKKYYYIDFRRCEISDFLKRGIKLNQNQEKAFKKKLCPNFDKYPDLARIRNKYYDYELQDRISLSVDIFTCISNCVSPSQVS